MYNYLHFYALTKVGAFLLFLLIPLKKEALLQMLDVFWLPLTRELSSEARLRERKVVLLCISIPSLPSSRQSRATSLVRGRQNYIESQHS